MTVVCGDMAKILPDLEVTVVITDPVWPNASVPLAGYEDPYGLFSRFCDAIPKSVARAAIVLGRDSDPGMLAPLQARLPFFAVCFLEYARPSYKGRLLNGFDVAYLYGEPPKGTGIIPGKSMFTRGGERRRDLHPCPRRLDHIEWLIAKWTLPDDYVCDPFAGSGTTVLAAKLAGRRAIGIEIDPAHHTNALRYLRENPVMDFAATT